MDNSQFVAFSCLFGDKNGLTDNLGTLFTPKNVDALQNFLDGKHLLVVIDDLEPVRIWQWEIPQREITGWLQLVLQASTIPKCWEVVLWSALESRSKKINYDEALDKIQNSKYALHIHKLYLHMQKFPNKKANLAGKKAFQEAATRRAAHYALQGVILEELFPSTILFQTETPWLVKDPLYQPLRNSPLPIVHPYEERR